MRIADIAIMQLIDIPHSVNINQNISDANRIFVAPELFEDGERSCQITGKADVYSVGAILYLIITKGVRNSQEKLFEMSTNK